ncbi:MAG TPA: SpoIIE family protein phosphatase [Alphaproteobacteria bacterium]|nr:SpoIIE family protein phosphatase [Alphaproteobacteria bacterium]
MLIEVADSSQVSVARRAASDAAEARGFDAESAGRVALVATELATNLLKHASRGEIVIGTYDDSSGSGIELLSLDRGEGIADLGRAFEDGVSTAGSPGNGLGAIRRQADQLDVFTRPKLGTAIAARVGNGQRSKSDGSPVLGAIAMPIAGERVCGDGWAFTKSAKGPTLVVADGSGHGPAAEIASRAALRTFQTCADEDCPEILARMHRELAPTRGAAVAVARVEREARVVRFAGVGNIAGAIVDPAGSVRRMVSHNGIVGHIAARIHEFSYPWSDGSLLLMHSDGLSTKWDFAAYPGLAASHPSLVAGILFRDFRRRTDDATVVAMRI